MSDKEQQAPFDIIALEGFTGINTESARPSIKDTEMAWCDGFMPIGDSTLRTIPDHGASIFTAPTSAINFFGFFNIGASPYAIIILGNGSIWIVRTDNPSIFAQFAAAGTVASPSFANCGITQWGSQFLILVANQPNGYWMIDGVNFFAPGGIAPVTPATITNGGIGYSTAPAYTVFGGTGSGVVLTVIVSGGSVSALQVVNPGSGYSPGDIVQVAFAGGGSNNSPILIAAITGGALTGVAVVNGGTNFGAPPPLTITGGGGFGATATAVLTAGVITSVTVATPGSGYYGTPAVIVSPGYNTAAYAILDVMPIGVQGTTVETYQGRVWVGDKTTVLFSAPESYTDFATSDGGGAFQSADSFLRVNYNRLKQANGFLYLIGDSSVNYIGGVSTAGSPPVTSFQNQNANPEVGTPYPGTVEILGSNIVFANAFGAHVSYGGNATKISTPLDGVYNSAPNNFGFQQLTSAKHILFGKRVWVLLVNIIDPVTNDNVNKLFMWDEKKWWSTQQGLNVNYIQSQEVNSIISAYGTDGSDLFPLFTTPSTQFTKFVRSKLFSKPGGYMTLKASNRAWLVAIYNTLLNPGIEFQVDSEVGVPALVTITPAGTGLFVSPPTAVSQTGALLGMTLATFEADMTLISAAIDSVPVGYRG